MKNSIILAGLAIILLLALVPIVGVRGEVADLYRLSYPGYPLRYQYIHSVEKTPVYEQFVIQGNNSIRLLKTGHKSYGAGLPLALNDYRKEAGWFIVSVDRVVSPLIFRVSSHQPQTITLGGRERELIDFSPVGKVVIIEVKPAYLWVKDWLKLPL